MPSIVAIRNKFNGLRPEVQTYLRDLQPLLQAADLDLSLAYLFMIIEQARYRSLKCLFVRRLKCMTSVVDRHLAERAFSRKTFRDCVKDLATIDLNAGDLRALGRAEKIRDKIFHGRSANPTEKREAIMDCLIFIDVFGQKINDKTGKNPFATLQGLTSRITPVNRSQSEWIVLGVLAVNNVEKIDAN